MGRRVTIEAFELLRDVESPLDHRLTVAFSLQPRLAFDRLLQRKRGRGILRHQLAEFVDLSIRHLQYAADVTKNTACLQRAEGDDLRHLVTPIALLDIADHLVPAVLAEVDVEIRHRNALGIEKPLEQQTEPDRIQIRDRECVGNQRPGARTTTGTNGYALFLRPLDEVRDDQEIARIFHTRDNTQLEVEPLAVFINGMARGHAGGCEGAFKPRPGALAQLAGLVERPSVITNGKTRKDGLMRPRTECAAPRDRHSRCNSFREIGKAFNHFRTRLKAMLRRQLPPLRLR